MVLPMARSICVSGRCGFVAACAVAAVAVSAPVVPVSAEPSHAQQRYSSYSDEQRARELYLDGIEKLQGGHSDVARRMFEAVAAQFPETVTGQRAQGELERLSADAWHADPTGPAIGHAAANRIDAVETQTFATGADAALHAKSPLGNLHADFDAAAVAVSGEITTGSLPLPLAAERQNSLHQGFRPTPAWDQEVRRNASIQARMRQEAGDRVFFSSGSAELGSRARMALAAQARWLKRWREFEATIAGYADEPGSDDDNVALSMQRAATVRQRLIDEGVAPGRLAIAPHGRSGRVAMCADAGCQAQNRRAVTMVFVAGTHSRLGFTTPSVAATVELPEDTAVIRYEQRDGRKAEANGHDNSVLVRQVGVTR